MTTPYIDTDPIVRLVTGDDPVKQAAASRLFNQVARGQRTIAAPIAVIADAVFVLDSPYIYRLPRLQVAAALLALVELISFQVQQKQVVIQALKLFGETDLDFGDAVLVATMEAEGAQTLISHDRHVDRAPCIRHIEPGQREFEADGSEL